MLLWLAIALADESGQRPTTPSTTFRVSVTIDAGDQPGPVWSWETVEVGPCTGELDEAVRTTEHRRWTWLSERDGLHVGVCSNEGEVEVRLEGDRRRAPEVTEVFLESGDEQFALRREEGRWLGDGTSAVSEHRELAFEPEAEARYRQVHDDLLAALDETDVPDPIDRGWDDPIDGIDGPLFDGADWDMWLDGPDGFGSGVGMGVFDVDGF